MENFLKILQKRRNNFENLENQNKIKYPGTLRMAGLSVVLSCNGYKKYRLFDFTLRLIVHVKSAPEMRLLSRPLGRQTSL